MEREDLEDMKKDQLIKYLLSLQTKIDAGDTAREALRAELEDLKTILVEKKKEEPKGFLESLFGVEE